MLNKNKVGELHVLMKRIWTVVAFEWTQASKHSGPLSCSMRSDKSFISYSNKTSKNITIYNLNNRTTFPTRKGRNKPLLKMVSIIGSQWISCSRKVVLLWWVIFVLNLNAKHRNNRYWSSENPHSVIQFPVCFLNFGVWCAVSARKNLWSVFFK